MAKWTIEVNITDKQIQSAVDKAGKLDRYAIQSLAETVVYNKVKLKMKKAIGNIDDAIDEAIENIDWQQVIIDRMTMRLTNDDY